MAFDDVTFPEIDPCHFVVAEIFHLLLNNILEYLLEFAGDPVILEIF